MSRKLAVLIAVAGPLRGRRPRARRRPRRFVELDSARPGAVANLRIDGDRALWSVDGEERGAVP
jgi:hypothetical protein